MKVLIFGKEDAVIPKLAQDAGLEVVSSNPEFVLCYGGDGTLMQAEHAFPGIPKVLLRGSAVCKKCSRLPNDEVLRRIVKGTYRIEELPKLEARAKGKALWALNDIIVHNQNPRHAIRYRLTVDETPEGEEIIGDGVVVATPFGSSGYYRSITDSFFEVGIGLAFNNSTEQSDHMVLRDDRTVRLTILRGPAVVYADNQEENIALAEGDVIEVKKSEKLARMVAV